MPKDLFLERNISPKKSAQPRDLFELSGVKVQPKRSPLPEPYIAGIDLKENLNEPKSHGFTGTWDDEPTTTSRVRRYAINPIKAAGASIKQGAGGIVQSFGESLTDTRSPAQQVSDRYGLNLGDMPELEKSITPEFVTKAGEKVAKVGKGIFDEALERVNELKPRDDAPYAEKMAFGVLHNLGLNAPGLALTILTKRPMFGLSFLGGISYGEKYGTERKRGSSIGQAHERGMGEAGSEVLTEFVTLSALMKPGLSLAKRTAYSLISELVGENFNTAYSLMQDRARHNPDKPFGDFVREDLMPAFADTSVISGISSLVMGGAAHPFVRERTQPSVPKKPRIDLETEIRTKGEERKTAEPPVVPAKPPVETPVARQPAKEEIPVAIKAEEDIRVKGETIPELKDLGKAVKETQVLTKQTTQNENLEVKPQNVPSRNIEVKTKENLDISLQDYYPAFNSGKILEIKNNLTGKKEGQIATLKEILDSPELIELFKPILDTKIIIKSNIPKEFDNPNYQVDAAAGKDDDGKYMIELYYKNISPELALDKVVEEAAHLLRANKGREFSGKLQTQTSEERKNLTEEKSADRLLQYVNSVMGKYPSHKDVIREAVKNNKNIPISQMYRYEKEDWMEPLVRKEVSKYTAEKTNKLFRTDIHEMFGSNGGYPVYIIKKNGAIVGEYPGINEEEAIKEVVFNRKPAVGKIIESEQGTSQVTKEPSTGGMAPDISKEPWQMNKDEYQKYIEDSELPDKMFLTHKEETQRALSEGKPVSAEVLKDYPDLQKVIPEEPLPKKSEEATPATHNEPKDEDRIHIIRSILSDLEIGQAPQLLTKEGEYGETTYTRTKSSNPEYFTNLGKQYAGISKAYIKNILIKASSGKKLTEKQSEILDELISAKSDEFMGMRRYIRNQLPKVPVGDLNLDVGDEFKINGETYRVTRKDEEGQYVIEDGETYVVDEFDKITQPDEGSLIKNKEDTALSRDELAEQIQAAQPSLSKEKIEAMIQLSVDTHAKVLGITPDEYIQKRIREVKGGIESEIKNKNVIYQSELKPDMIAKIEDSLSSNTLDSNIPNIALRKYGKAHGVTISPSTPQAQAWDKLRKLLIDNRKGYDILAGTTQLTDREYLAKEGEEEYGKESIASVQGAEGKGIPEGQVEKVGEESLSDYNRKYAKLIPIVVYGNKNGEKVQYRTDLERKDEVVKQFKDNGYTDVGWKQGEMLYQGKKGAIEFYEDGRAIIYLLENSDESTFIHEMFHMYIEREMSADQLRPLESLIGKPKAEWTTDDKEKAAKSGEKYLWEGNAPTQALKALFEKFKAWLREIYKTAKSLDVELSDDVRKLWDDWFSKEEIKVSVEAEPMPSKGHRFSVGQRIQIARSPQMYTITEALKSSEEEMSLGEVYYTVKNDNTGKVEDILESDIRQPKGTSATADTGGYSELAKGNVEEPIREGSAPKEPAVEYPPKVPMPEELVKFEMPELVEIAKELLGDYPEIKNYLGDALGVFYPSKGKISLRRMLSSDPELAALVLSHEIGHGGVDWLPQKTMIRGNLLGRIGSFRDYLKKLMKEYLAPGNVTGKVVPPAPILTKQDRERFNKYAIELARAAIDGQTAGGKEVLPAQILEIWNDLQGKEKNPMLYDFIVKLNEVEKKQILLDAIKGKGFSLPENVQEFKNLDDKTKEIYRNLIREEIIKRKLYEEEVIRQELKNLSQIWKPFDEKQNPSYTKYRHSGKELYADAISVLLHNPRLLAEKAPSFYKAFFSYLENKPEFSDLYFSITEMYKKGDIAEHRTELSQAMTDVGEKAFSLPIIEKEKRTLKDKVSNLIGGVKREFLDQYSPLYDGIKNKRTKATVRNYVEDHIYKDSEKEYYYKEIYYNGGLKETIDAGITEHQLADYVKMRRIVYDNKGLYSPGGHTIASAQSVIDKLKETLGEDKFKILEDSIEKFWGVRQRNVISKMIESGRYPASLIEEIENNKYYVTFDHTEAISNRFGRRITPRLYKRKGSLKDVANPYTATILKDMAILDWMTFDIAKEQSVMGLVKDKHIGVSPAQTMREPIYIPETKETRFVQTPREPDDKRFGLVTWVSEGKVVGYYLPVDVATVFEKSPIDSWAAVKVLGKLTQPMRELLTRKRPGFALYNILKDAPSAMMVLPGANLHNFPIYQIKAIKRAAKGLHGYDPSTQRLLKGKALLTSVDYSGMTSEETQLERLQIHYGLANPTKHNIFMRQWYRFMAAMNYMSDVSERTTKLAIVDYLDDKFPDMPEADKMHLVRWSGSPAFLVGGEAKPIFNNIFMFMNPQIQGWRIQVESAKESPLGYSLKTIEFAIIPKILMFLGLSGYLGEEIKRLYQKVSPYGMNNYAITVLGETKSGKVISWYMPQSETHRFIGGLFWQLLHGMKKPSDLLNIFDYTAGQFPGLNPAISVMLDLVTLATGKEIYDYFRGKTAIPPEVRKMQDWNFITGEGETAKAYGKYFSNKLGLTLIHKFDTDNISKIRSDLEKILGYPGLSDTLGRFLRVEDSGESAEYYRSRDVVMKEEARKRVRELRAIENLVNKVPIEKWSNNHKKALAGMLENKTQKQIMEKVSSYLTKSGGNALERALESATSKAQKIAILKKHIEMYGIKKEEK